MTQDEWLRVHHIGWQKILTVESKRGSMPNESFWHWMQVLSGSPRGLQIFRLMETGELVPSIIVLHLLTEAMVTIENINYMYSIAQKAKKQWFNILEGGQNLWRQGKRLFTWCLPLQHRPGEEELETAPVSLFTAFNFEIFCQISKATQYYCLL